MKVLIILLIFSFQSLASTRTFFNQGRNYKLTTPYDLTQKRPLLVLLHGCRQNASIILEKSLLEDQALSRNFFILTPEQSSLMNMSLCWNWFYSEQQKRSPFTEMGGIVATLKALITIEQIDSERIYVAGLSAGGALTHALSVCYPDVFKGAAIHSGLAFKSAENLQEGQNILKTTKLKSPQYLGAKALACAPDVKRKLKKVLIIQGLDDESVRPMHAQLISDTNWAMRNESYAEERTNKKYPHGYTIEIIQRKSQNFQEISYFVKGLKHAWGGGENFDYFDPAAPSSNELIIEAFEL